MELIFLIQRRDSKQREWLCVVFSGCNGLTDSISIPQTAAGTSDSCPIPTTENRIPHDNLESRSELFSKIRIPFHVFITSGPSSSARAEIQPVR